MFAKNVETILSQIKPDDLVLDLGGWAQPFTRANFVLDIAPYETRGWYGKIGAPASMGGTKEYFTSSSWFQLDLCSRQPYPFADKYIDYVICSHVLEDVRDPLWICSEMVRIGKRGYIEVPSRLVESIFSPATGTVGASHHRWLVTIEHNKISFEMKYHLIHRRGLHLPNYTLGLLKPEQTVQWLFWTDSFEFEEAAVALGEEEIKQRLQDFVEANQPASSWGYRVGWEVKRWLRPLRQNLKRRLKKVKI